MNVCIDVLRCVGLYTEKTDQVFFHSPSLTHSSHLIPTTTTTTTTCTQNGKRQARNVAISNNGRVLHISTEKVSMRKMIRKRSKLLMQPASSSDDVDSSFKSIEISSIDRIVRGQITKKFLNK